MNQYAQELRDLARRQRAWDQAWYRYINALARAADKQADGRANYGRRRAVRAARRNLDRTCVELGVESPV